MLETIILLLILIFFIAWCCGVIEGHLFSRFVRKEFPDVAERYFPGMLRGSIHQQLETTGWLWNRSYTKLDVPRLTRRADLHRIVGFVAFGAMIVAMLGLLIGGRFVTSGDESKTNEETEHVVGGNGE